MSGRLPRVLIVDDHPLTCSSVQRALNGRYAIDAATNGADALRLIRETDYALILCDLVMPGMSGYELIEILARESPRALVRVVAITARFCTAGELRKLAAFGVQVLHKPFGAAELAMVVPGYIARASGDL